MTQHANAPIRQVVLIGSGDQSLAADETGALVTIDYPHHELHEGNMYVSTYALDVTNGANMDMTVLSPNSSTEVHLTGKIFTEAEAHIYWYEGATATGGADKTPVNRNRRSIKTSGVTVAAEPTVSSTGVLKWEAHTGSGRATGGGARADEEWELAQNTKYLLRITNATATNNYCSVELNFYEHTPGD